MLDRAYDWLDRNRGWGVLALRLAVGVRLVEGTQDNVFSQERMEEFAHFLAEHGTPLPLALDRFTRLSTFTPPRSAP